MVLHEGLNKKDKEELIIDRIKRLGGEACELDILNTISLVVLEQKLFSDSGEQLLSNNEFLKCKKCFNAMEQRGIIKQKNGSTKYFLDKTMIKKIEAF